jgi:hypothetical protein
VATWANAQVATVRIDPSRAGPAVNRQVLSGFNFGNWMSVTEFRDEIAKVPAAALRFPGGNIGDEHDMDEPTLDAFKSLLSQVAGERELLVQTRVFQGRPDRPAANTPQDAARAVRLARDRGLNVRSGRSAMSPTSSAPCGRTRAGRSSAIARSSVRRPRPSAAKTRRP